MKLLITGANGFLGQHLCHHLAGRFELLATARGASRIAAAEIAYQNMDITDAGSVSEIFSAFDPDTIIHTAAISRPDECLRNIAYCRAVNVTGMNNIVNACRLLAKPPQVVYTSSDFVLGDDGPHDETAVPAPLNVYGETKLEAEQLLQSSGLPATIVRPVFMYGSSWTGMRPTFLHWVNDSLSAGKEIRVVNDQWRTPSYVADICQAIEAVIVQRSLGLYHLGGPDVITPYQMALQFAKYRGLNGELINPVTAESFPEPVQRARRGGVRSEKAITELGYAPRSIEQGLQELAASF